MLACDVGQNIVTTPAFPFPTSPKQATNIVFFFTLLPYTQAYTPTGLFRQGSSAIRLSEPCAPASSRSRSHAARTGKYAHPAMGPASR